MLTRGLLFVAAVLFYGYFQKVSASGFLVAVVLGLRFLSQRRWLPSAAFVAYLATLFVEVESVQSTAYLFLASSLLWSSPREQSDTEVRFKPFEEEIRQFLFKHDHTVLHKVDGWLAKYAGKELELLERVKAKYGPAHQRSKETPPPTQQKVPKPSDPQATPSSGRRGYSFKDDSSPVPSSRPAERTPASLSSDRSFAPPSARQTGPFQFSPYATSYYNDDVRRQFTSQSGIKPAHPSSTAPQQVGNSYSASWATSSSYPRNASQLGGMDSRLRHREGSQ